MAMIEVSKKDVHGKPQIIYYDTDDLSQEDYCEFRRLQREGKQIKAVNFLIEKVEQVYKRRCIQ